MPSEKSVFVGLLPTVIKKAKGCTGVCCLGEEKGVVGQKVTKKF